MQVPQMRMPYVTVSMWEERSELQVVSCEAKKFRGQAGAVPSLPARARRSTVLTLLLPEARISSSHCSLHRPYQPQGGHSSPLSASRPPQLPALPRVGQRRPQRAALRTGKIAEAGISHLQQHWTWLRRWVTGEAFSYGPGGLASWHYQAPFPASPSLLSNLEQGTALPSTTHDRGDIS